MGGRKKISARRCIRLSEFDWNSFDAPFKLYVWNYIYHGNFTGIARMVWSEFMKGFNEN